MLTVVCLLFVSYAAGGNCERDPPITMTLCGRHLAEAREQFCFEAGLLLKKRSWISEGLGSKEKHALPALPESDGESDNAIALPNWPFLPSESAHALLDSRRKRGIVDECCYKPCTVDELLTYC